MSAANADDVSLNPQCVAPPEREGFVLQADYQTPRLWAALVLDLKNANIEQYDTLTFFAKGQNDGSMPLVPKIELKRPADHSRVGIAYLRDVTNTWKQFTIPLKDLQQFGQDPFLCGWTDMSELNFTLESARAGKAGTIFLDDIYLERRGAGAPTPPAACATPTSAPTELLSATPTSAPTELLSATPTKRPLPTNPPSLLVADFDSCSAVNNLNGGMGGAYNPPDLLVDTRISESNRGCVSRLEYHIGGWAAYWNKLGGANASKFKTLRFDIRADPAVGIPSRMKIEVKKQNGEWSILYVEGITDQWQTMSVDLGNFVRAFENKLPIQEFNDLDELVFTFEQQYGRDGVVYLDNIRFQ